MDLNKSLDLGKEQNERLSIQSEGGGCWLLQMFINENLVVDVPKILTKMPTVWSFKFCSAEKDLEKDIPN